MLLCCGEALIDMLPVKCGPEQEDGFIPRPGGSVFNTAIALGRLGARPGFFSGLSTDMFGEMLAKALVESKVDTGLCLRTDRPTTMAYVRLQNGNATYVFHDENSAVRMISEADLPALTDEVSALFFGGISLAAEPCADAFVSLALSAHRNRVIMVDPNIRPAFIADEKRFRNRLKKLLQVADIVKVSEEDLEWLVPGELTWKERAETLTDLGASLVLVTFGGQGVHCYRSDGSCIEKPIEPVEVVDTVGAGDTFNAGFLHALESRGLLEKAKLSELSDEEVAKALDLGTMVAGVVVSRRGANPPWASELGLDN